jgi:cell division protein FtsI (penicillin-binding protein 3)
MQLAGAVAAVGNRGQLLEPLLVKRVTDSTGVVLDEPKARVRRATTSPAVAKMLLEMLVSVTEGEGTGVEASVSGFRVAGKTATAQKIDPETGRYTDTHYVASFVGLIPAERPRLAIVVMIDEPLAGTYAGGSVAAPVFRRVAEMALSYLGVTPDVRNEKGISEATELAKNGDPTAEAFKVIGQTEEADDTAPKAPQRKPKAGEVLVPDLSGYPAREAIQRALAIGLVPSLDGSGRVLRTEPPASEVVKAGTRILITLEPPT